MFASCLMVTYGKYVNPENDLTHLIDEAVEAFHRQTYPHKELIILNDQSSLKYDYSHPEVIVVNSDLRCSSVGAKRNAAIKMSRGDVCLVWDDDDISLPTRVENVVNAFANDRELVYTGSSNTAFSTDNANYQHVTVPGFGRTASGAVLRSVALDHPYENTTDGEDMHMCYGLMQRGLKVEAYASPEIDFLYRWGLGVQHASACTPERYQKLGEQDFVQHTHKISPKWLNDYVAEVRRLESVEH